VKALNSAEESRSPDRDFVNDILTVEELAARLRLKPSWVYTHADTLGAIASGNIFVSHGVGS
jgi:hypothetical protein